MQRKSLQTALWLCSLLMSTLAYAGVPTFSAALSPSTIGPGSLSRLTYTIDNSAQSTGVSNLDFSTSLPSGVTFTASPNAFTTCTNGTFAAEGGGNSITFSGYRLGPNASCTFAINVTASIPGTYTIAAATLSTSAGSDSNATMNLTVDGNRPGLTMAFEPSTITPGGISTLTYTIDNTANGSDVNRLIFSDRLTSGLLIADAPNVTTESNCVGANHSFTPGTDTFSGSVFSLAAGQTCTVKVDVTAALGGKYLNISSSLSQNGSNPSGPASAELIVETKFLNAFFPGAVKPGESVKLTYTLTNTDRSFDATGITFTNDLNATLSGLTASALPANNFCGSGSTMTGSTNLTINGANLASGDSCTFAVTVLIPSAAASGSYTNNTSTVNLTLGSATTQPAASNTLTVVKPIALTALFVDDPVTAGADVTLRYTLTNTDANNAASNIEFNQNYDETIGGVMVKTLPNANSCGTGSTVTTNTADGIVFFVQVTNASLAGGGTCTFDVILTLPADATTGTWLHTTTIPSATITDSSNSSTHTVFGTAATDNLIVVAAPTLSLAITQDNAVPGATLAAEFTLNYSPQATADVTGVGFTVDLENALTGLVSITATQNDVCGSGSIFGGTSTLTLSGANMPTGGTCSFLVTLKIPEDATPSTITVLSSKITGTSAGQAVSAGATSDTVIITGLSWGITVLNDPTAAGETNTLRFTINNAASGLAATAISTTMNLHEALPGLHAISLPSVPCNGNSQITGSTSLTFSNGSLQPGQKCTFDVPISVPANALPRGYNLSTSDMSATVVINDTDTNTVTPAVTTVLNVESLIVNVSTTATSPYNTTPIPVNIDFSRAVNGFTLADLAVSNGSASNLVGSGLTYTVDITPTASGTVTVSLPASSVTDDVFNSIENPASNTLSLTYEADPTFSTPTIAISAPSTSHTKAGPVTYTVTYTHAPDISISPAAIILNKTGTANATVTVTTVDALTRTITLSNITGDGTLGLSINKGTARNGDRQAPAIGPSSTFTVDNSAPTLAITATVVDIINVPFVATFTFTFSEPVSGFALADITVGNGSATNFRATSTLIYTADITPTSEGNVTVDVIATAAQDTAGNHNLAATQYVIIYDKVPTVVISGPAGPVKEKFTATVTFNEIVTDFVLSDIVVGNGTADNFVVSDGKTYTANITPTSDNPVTVDVAAGVAKDTVNNTNTAATQFSVSYDATPPTVAITGPVGPLNTTFNATVTFSEIMTAFVQSDITTGNATLSDFATSDNKVFTVKVMPTTDGNVTLDVPAGVATDSATNGNTASPQYAMVSDMTHPTLQITGPSTTINALFTTTFTFSEDVTGFELSDIVVANATIDQFSALNAKQYTATVTPTIDGQQVTVDVAASVAIDTTTNPNVAASQFAVGYDLQKPSVAVTGPTGPLNAPFTATVTFNKVVVGFEQNKIVAANAGLSNFVATNAPSYTVLVTPTNEGKVTLSIAEGVVADVAGNTNAASNVFTLVYNITDPILATFAPTNNQVDVTIKPDLVLTFDQTVTAGTTNNLIEIKDLTTDAVLQSLAANSAAVSINDNIVTITLTSQLAEASEFYVTIDSNAFSDAATNKYSGISDNATWRFKVINLPPLTLADNAVVLEDTSVNIDVLNNDNGDNSALNPASVTVKTAASNGTTIVNTALGMITYTPNANYNGSDTFTYIVSDILGTFSAENSVTVTVDPANDAPVAVNDTASTILNNATTINVLDNDGDVDGVNQLNSNTINITAQARHGDLTLINGSVSYQPATDYSGSDTFSYTVKDSADAVSNVALVTINIIATNAAPSAVADSATTNEDTVTTINVLANDTDNDGQIDATTVTIAGKPANGEASINTDGTITYTPDTDFFGNDSFSYSVKDNGDARSLATNVTITVSAVNDAPTVASDTVIVLDTTSAHWINVIGNDKDVDGSINSVAILTQPSTGTVTVDSTSLLVLFTPKAGFNGTDSFTYQLTDNNNTVSSTATVSLSQTPVNVAPLVNDDTIQTDEEQFIDIDVLANDSDFDGQIIAATLAITSPPSNGSASVKLSDGTIFYTPNANFSGSDSFVYQVSDNSSAAGSATVHIQVNNVNDAPQALSQIAQTDEDASIAILAEGIDADNDNLTYQIDSSPNNGTLSGTLPEVTYTPNTNFNGADSFQFIVNDGTVDSTAATITIEIATQNDTPVAIAQTLVLSEDTPKPLILTGSDIDNDTLSYVVKSSPANGQLRGTGANLTYTPNTDFNGTDGFTFAVNDGTADSSTATVSLNIAAVNDAPVAQSQAVQTIEDTLVDILVVASDVEQNSLTYILQQSPIHGVLTGVLPAVTYDPDANYSGTDSFTYIANDGLLNSAPVTVNISIFAVNDQPVAITRSLITAEGLSLTVTLSATDSDNDPLTYTAISDPTNGVLSGVAPNLVYTPNTGFSGNDSFTFTANDGTDDSSPAAINISITPINDVPLAVDDTLIQTGWAPADIDVLANDSDLDNDSLTIIGATADVGIVSFTSTRLTYTPLDGFVGSTTLNYTISDGQGGITSARVRVTISAPAIRVDLATINVPADIEINANALLSKVDLGIATATDSKGNAIAVSLLDDTTFFKPGINTVYWSATDDAGQTTIASQTVTVHPLISLDSDQITREGYAARVGVHLNGTAPSYPLNIPYTVSGTAQVDSDHNLADGIVTIESGINGSININLFDDGVLEGEEQIVITLGDTLNQGQQFSHTITLMEENVAPKVNLQVLQGDQQNAVVNRENGTVEIKAQVTHPDSTNLYSYSWDNSEQLINISATENGFAFEPDELIAGLYYIELSITDIDDSQFSLTKQVTIKIEASAVVLGTNDSDDDGVSDLVEGAGDSDNDGIADYLDAIDACNVLPGSIDSTTTHLVEAQPGVCLRLGDRALNRGNSGVRIDEIATNASMDSHKGSLYDLVADKLPVAGQSIAIVLPQVQPIPADAIYRLLLQDGQWTDFVQNSDNQLLSSAGESGYCPPPGFDNWQAGLIEGHWCIQLRMNDGGPNDGDNQANGTIVTPSRVEVLMLNSQPIAQDDEAQTRQNVALTIDVLANDTDNDGDNLSVSTANAQFGTVSIIDHQIHYQPATDLIGVDTIVYGISDGQGGSSSATLSVTVLANSTPIAVNDLASVGAGQSIVIDVLANDSDPENDSLSVVTALADNGRVTIGADFRLIYKPNNGFTGTDHINYLVSDAHGGEAMGLVNVSVITTAATTPPNKASSSTGGGSTGWALVFIVFVWFYNASQQSKLNRLQQEGDCIKRKQ